MKVDLPSVPGPGEPQPQGYVFGPFRLDQQKRRLWRDDALVALTPKAFDTLLVLVRHAGTIVDKDELLKRVWPDTFVGEETLTQNISTLRKALGDTSGHPDYIATVPRRGYQFIGTVRTLDLVPPANPLSVWEGPAAARRAPTRWPRTALAAGVLVAGVSLALLYLWRDPGRSKDGDLVHFVVTPPDGSTFAATGGVLALSPDGRQLALVAADERGVSRLWLRALGSASPQLLAGTEGASQPFWSADGTSLAFAARGKLHRIDLASGRILTICDGGLAGTWNRDGTILFAARDSDILRVSADGGLPVPVTRRDQTLRETEHLWPVFLPDGRHFLFFARSADRTQSAIYVGSLDEPGSRTLVTWSSSSVEYAWPGYLLFRDGDALVSRTFDEKTLRLIGEPTIVAERLVYNSATGRVPVSASRTGPAVLVYRTWTDNELVWVDRGGRRLARVGSPGPYFNPSLSSDGTRVAVSRLDPRAGTEDVWVIDIARGGMATRLTTDPADDTQPVWSPDGRRVIFNSNRNGHFDFYEKPSNGLEDERPLLTTPGRKSPLHWSPDGRVLLYRSSEASDPDLWLLPLVGQPVPVRLPRTRFSDSYGEFSPDGRWLAHGTSESGIESAVFIQSFPDAGVRRRISPGGGREPHWRGDGRELFYVADDDTLMSATIRPGSAGATVSAPRALFRVPTRPNVGGTIRTGYAVAPDGQRFLLNLPVEGSAVSPVHVIFNWPSRTTSSPASERSTTAPAASGSTPMAQRATPMP